MTGPFVGLAAIIATRPIAGLSPGLDIIAAVVIGARGAVIGAVALDQMARAKAVESRA
jgi:isopentenyl diphosphate isomerase/L-lactate dehydrogenase-like FMN-dependent dehydrogenase